MTKSPPVRAGRGPCEREQVDRAILRFKENVDREPSFRLLVDCFYHQVRSFFSRKPNLSAEDRLDLTQETFLRVYKGLKGYRGEAQFGTWLFRIARNTYLKRRPKVLEDLEGFSMAGEALEVAGEDGRDAVDPKQRDPQQDALVEEQRRLLHEAIAELPVQMRQCMLLRVGQDLKLREIASMMNLSTETVKAHLFQARKKLRGRLEGYFESVDF